MKNAFVGIFLIGVFSIIGLAAEVHLPADAPLSGTILIAESFYEMVDDEPVAIPIAVWQGSNGMRDTSWFDTRIEAHPGDLIVLDPGQYQVDIWIFTPDVTVTTDPASEEIADIWGTVEIDADGVILDRIAVTGSRKDFSSGHGIEVNREELNTVTIRNCLVEGNDWMGIHVIGPRGQITRMVVENCVVRNNRGFGIEAQATQNLIISGCTVTGNKQGIHIGSNVLNVVLEDNLVAGNKDYDIFRKE